MYGRAHLARLLARAARSRLYVDVLGVVDVALGADAGAALAVVGLVKGLAVVGVERQVVEDAPGQVGVGNCDA